MEINTNHNTKKANGEAKEKTSNEVIIDVVNPKQEIGLWSAVTFGLGCMIGSGIFISPKGALSQSGSVGNKTCVL